MGQKLNTKTSGVGIANEAFIIPQADPVTGKVYKMTNDEFSVMMGTYTPLITTVWDGKNRTKTLAANTVLTLSSTRISGILEVIQDGTGGRTLSVNGTVLTINMGANSKTLVGFLNINGVYLLVVELNAVTISSPDVTAPGILTVTVENANRNKIIITYEEPMDTGSVPAASAFTASGGKTVTAVAIVGAVVTVTVDSNYTSSDVITVSYVVPVSNPARDVDLNNALAFSNHAVTNNISSGATLGGTTWYSHHDPALGRTVTGAGVSRLIDQAQAANSTFDLVQGTDANRPAYVASGINSLPTIEIDNNKFISSTSWFLGPTNLELPKPFTRIIVIQPKALPASFLNFVTGFSVVKADIGHYNNQHVWVYSGTSQQGTTPLVVDNVYVIWVEFAGDAANDKLYVNGTLQYTGDFGNHGALRGVIWGEAGGGAHVWMGEEWIYNGIFSGTDRGALTTEIKTKFAIP